MFVLHELSASRTKDRSHKRVFFDFCFLDYEFAADALVTSLCSSLFQTKITERKPSAKMSSSTAMYASLSILSLCALAGTGVAIGSGVGMMSMELLALEAEKKQTVAAHSVKEQSWVESKQVSGSSARGFAAAGRQ